MSITFKEEDHSYTSNNQDGIYWISVTSLTSHFKEPFDAKKVAQKVSKRKNSKWYGMKPKQIQDIWKKESERAMTLGTFYHNQREADLCALASIERATSTHDSSEASQGDLDAAKLQDRIAALEAKIEKLQSDQQEGAS